MNRLPCPGQQHRPKSPPRRTRQCDAFCTRLHAEKTRHRSSGSAPNGKDMQKTVAEKCQLDTPTPRPGRQAKPGFAWPTPPMANRTMPSSPAPANRSSGAAGCDRRYFSRRDPKKSTTIPTLTTGCPW
jgi:hypothetical protein